MSASVENDTLISKKRTRTLVTNLINTLKSKNIMPEAETNRFLEQVDRFSRNPPIAWSKVKPLPSSKVASFDVLESCPDNSEVIHLLLDKVCVIKLNGGLGTSMGCRGPKSAIEVKNEYTFLDMAVSQIQYLNIKYGVDVPLLLMN